MADPFDVAHRESQTTLKLAHSALNKLQFLARNTDPDLEVTVGDIRKAQQRVAAILKDLNAQMKRMSDVLISPSCPPQDKERKTRMLESLRVSVAAVSKDAAAVTNSFSSTPSLTSAPAGSLQVGEGGRRNLSPESDSDAEDDRTAFLGAGGRPPRRKHRTRAELTGSHAPDRDIESGMPALSPQQMSDLQTRMFEQQNEELDLIEGSVNRLKHVGTSIRDELTHQNHLLTQLENSVSSLQDRLKNATRNVDQLLARMSSSRQCCLVVALVGVLVMLFFLLFTLP